MDPPVSDLGPSTSSAAILDVDTTVTTTDVETTDSVTDAEPTTANTSTSPSANDVGPTSVTDLGPADVDPTANTTSAITDAGPTSSATPAMDVGPTIASSTPINDLAPIPTASSVTNAGPTSAVDVVPTYPIDADDIHDSALDLSPTTSPVAVASPPVNTTKITTSVAVDSPPANTTKTTSPVAMSSPPAITTKIITPVAVASPPANTTKTTSPVAVASPPANTTKTTTTTTLPANTAKTTTTTTIPATFSAMAPLLSDQDLLSSLDPLPCPHSDSELVRKLAQLLLPALATAAVDSTTGDPFHSPASVAFDLRRDLVDHLCSLSLTFIPHTLSLLTADPSISDNNLLPDLDDPLDVLSFLVDDFAASRRNLLGRVTGWLLSDSRDDKIDDFVQEMENNCFWPLDRRETVADVLLKNLDFKHRYHCAEQFTAEEDLQVHKENCIFRPVSCKNDGCKVIYCKARQKNHEKVCLYKVIDCEQKCGEKIVRREMDRHCITVCRMKIMNCPFYQLGCHAGFPQGLLKEHCDEYLLTHMVGVMGVKNEEGLAAEELKERAVSMEQV